MNIQNAETIFLPYTYIFSAMYLLIFLGFLLEVPVAKEELSLVYWNNSLGRKGSIRQFTHTLKSKCG